MLNAQLKTSVSCIRATSLPVLSSPRARHIRGLIVALVGDKSCRQSIALDAGRLVAKLTTNKTSQNTHRNEPQPNQTDPG